MDSKQGFGTSGVANARTYEDFDPHMEWAKEDSSFDTLLVYLPGFVKEKLKTQITSAGKLRISGDRAVGQNKLRRFLKEFPLAADCDTNKISQKFEGGILYVKVPKSPLSTHNINHPIALPPPSTATTTTTDQKPVNNPKPSAAADHQTLLAPKPDQKLQQQQQVLAAKPPSSLEKPQSNNEAKLAKDQLLQPNNAKAVANDDEGLKKIEKKKSGEVSSTSGYDGPKLLPAKKPEAVGKTKTLSRLETYKNAIVKSPRALVNLLLAVLFVGVLALYVKNMFKSIGHIKSSGTEGEL